MSKRLYDFYLEVPKEGYNKEGTSEHDDIHIFKGALSDFTHIEELYGKLWFNVIDKQLEHIDYNKDSGYPIKQLTEDKIMLNWEGSDIYALATDTNNKFYYLGNGVLSRGETV
tara:strand:+ start:131 stop:469 length:339 start_codon:yes stop_codon:yes gene_type:complete